MSFLEWTLDTTHLGRRVVVHDQTDSTNNRAAELANDPANDGTVILAREQTAGRGQYGRTWQAPPGSSVLLSVLLFPPPELRRPALLTAWAAVSVCEAVRLATNLQAKIKWPNDVLIHGKKVCGILIEQRTVAGTLATVCGIGLNVRQGQDAFQHPGLENATSLQLAAGKELDWEGTARLLVQQLDEEYQRLRAGDLATLEACWKWRLGLLGKPVTASCVDGTWHGRLRELGWAGLELEQADGVLVRLPPESVRQLSAG